MQLAGTLKLVTPPAMEPVTLAEAKLHLRVDGTDEDALITSLIRSARLLCEQWCGRAFLSQTWDLWLDDFPPGCHQFPRNLYPSGGAAAAIELPMPPLASITWIKYTDLEGNLVTLDAGEYLIDDQREPGRVLPAYGKAWPAVRRYINAVSVRFVAGVADVNLIDERVKQAIKLIAGHWYQNREEVLVGTISKPIENAARMLMDQLWHGSLM